MAHWDAVWDRIEANNNEIDRHFEAFIASLKQTKYLCLFGAANAGIINKDMLETLGITVSFFCDNDSQKWGKYIGGIQCISPEQLKSYNGKVTIAITSQAYPYIYKQLQEMGLDRIFRLIPDFFPKQNRELREFIVSHKEDYKRALNIWADDKSVLCYIKRLEYLITAETAIFWEEIRIDLANQYFDPELIALTDTESFVDAGAFDGDTLLSLLRHTNGKLHASYEFELDELTLKCLNQTVQGLPEDVKEKVRIISKGLSDVEDEFEMESTGSAATSFAIERLNIGESIKSIAKVVLLDAEIKEAVSFIKMDIEGAELAALKGAAKTIRLYRPILAISVYHKLEDIFTLPEYILSLVPDYKLYMRHYTKNETDTVLYAIPPERTKHV